MTLENRLLERVGKEFAYSEQAAVVELLSSYAGPQAERVCWDILKLSNGNLEKVRQCIEAAWAGYCDVVCWPRYLMTIQCFDRGGRRVGRTDPRQMRSKGAENCVTAWIGGE